MAGIPKKNGPSGREPSRTPDTVEVFPATDLTDAQAVATLAASARNGEGGETHTPRSGIFAGLDHELRTQLGAIIGIAQLLLDKAADAELREGLTAIRHCAGALQRHVSEMLDLADDGAGRMRPEPRARKRPADGSLAPGQSPAPPDAAGATARLHILLAEDEPVNRIFTVRTLQKLGHTVKTAADGREALVMLGREPFDLVLMDIQMPRLNGLDATRMIRTGQVPGLHAAIPVVALTAYAMETDRELGFAAGMDEYITKPFEPQELAAAMQRAMAK